MKLKRNVHRMKQCVLMSSCIVFLRGFNNQSSVIQDVGSGLGHLARVLAYKYGYYVTAVERTKSQLPVARKYDQYACSVYP